MRPCRAWRQAALLRLYPSNFRRQFEEEMLETFSLVLDERGALPASLLILRELIPTLLGELAPMT